MKPLSSLLDDRVIGRLRTAIDENRFPGVTFQTAMTFLLTDGIFPESGLPVQSFLDLEDWMRGREGDEAISFTATQLKNETGRIIDTVMQGKRVVISRHGRPIAVIHPTSDS